VNANNQYDEGIDTPLDTAIVNRGEYLGINIFPGAKNSEETSFVHVMNGDPYMRDPANPTEARNSLLGKSVVGELYDPCTLPYGNVSGEPCDEVNPLFLYSGDPVANNGWINTYPADHKILTSTGPFNLSENEPIDIWIAYVVGRGNNALESVTKTKEYSAAAQYFYNSNFMQLPANVKNESYTQKISEFRLFQNYPNPYNPTTRINFSLAQKQLVKLTVFDILGREVRTLINEEKTEGSYSLKFDGSRLASGVYFFQLKAGNNIATRKMILLK
jgi:hypothetical protein